MLLPPSWQPQPGEEELDGYGEQEQVGKQPERSVAVNIEANPLPLSPADLLQHPPKPGVKPGAVCCYNALAA